MIRWLEDAVAQDCGGKAATMGALRRSGFPVPEGFVIPFSAYLAAATPSAPPDADVHDDAVRSGAGVPVIPPELTESIARHLSRWSGAPVAVRSSARDEDTRGASAAGQYATVLGARDVASVSAAVRTCWSSLHSDRARSYRHGRARRAPAGPGAMAVLVQRLVDARVSGVMFTSSRGHVTRIESAWGLGIGTVGGTVDPDRYEVHDDGTVMRTIGRKLTRSDRSGDTIRTRRVPEPQRVAPTLDDALANTLRGLGEGIADLLGAPQDIEWAMDGGGIWILQARPVTAEVPSPASATASSPLRGIAGSRGIARGPARIVTGPADFARVRRGDILVCRYTDPSWTPLLRVAAGVVTETGGALSHAAIVAREHGIPAVLGVPGATGRIIESAALTIDGARGTVDIHLAPRHPKEQK
ncbi:MULTISPECIES: PEP/pyruvate-binding domain-containing protein [Microbacterium]|uniref:Pyruvate, phosphate dikinase n=1 Tax=Microbacterium wangchenii TaxID=2541726 RepID=A0ABX5SQI5_9MICO|nr:MULTISPECIES: PEP/pyruvate-binding domain-containing protein [Microbacterium]MCK6064933.1 pyruvate, phosphate dikinase [Microbacterium sp. EYE_512]QBR88411.1 pyruvate, phosphate dikinase [Microbacterium wangchenii]TXK20138.1 pyruvate, phosphate dikinase [Microbacterium wangchenii]